MPCNPTKSSRVRNGSRPARRSWRMRRSSPSPRSAQRGAPRAAVGQVEKAYAFDGPNGKETLADLFEGRSQLVVQHFMFAPGVERGLQELLVLGRQLRRHDPAPRRARRRLRRRLARAAGQARGFQQRMGWTFKWVSSASSDFNYDFAVSFTPERQVRRQASTITAPPLRQRGSAGHQRVLPGRRRRDLPHLLDLRARPGNDERRLPLSRPDAAGPP